MQRTPLAGPAFRLLRVYSNHFYWLLLVWTADGTHGVHWLR